MVALQLNDEWLDLDGVKVRLRINSQLFDPEFVKHSFSYPISLPGTSKNNKLLDHAQRIGNVKEPGGQSVRIYLGGIYYRTGKLVYKGSKNDYHDVELVIPPDDVVQSMQGAMLQDFDYSGPFDMAPPFAPTMAEVDALYLARVGTIDDTPFVFPVIKNAGLLGDSDFYGGPDPDVEDYTGYVNLYNTSGSFLNYNLAANKYYVQPFTPCFYLVYIIQQLFSAFGYSINGQVLEEDETKRQVVLTNYLHTVVIEVNAGSATYNNGDESIDVGYCLPYMTCLELLIAIQQRFAAVFNFRPGMSCELKTFNEVLDGSDAMDLDAYVAIGAEYAYEPGDGYVLEQQSEDLDELARPDDEDIDTDLIAEVYDDLATLITLGTATEGALALVRNENYIYRYGNVGSSTQEWRPYQPYLYPERSGDEGTSVSIGVSLTRMERLERSTGNDWLVPSVNMVGYTKDDRWHMLGPNHVTKLRLLYYRGMVDDEAANDYPFATVGIGTVDGTTVSGATDFERIQGDDGIYQKRWQRWLNVLQNGRSITAFARLPLHMVTSFDFTRKVRYQGHEYLVRSIDLEVSASGPSLAKLDLLKV